MSRKKVRSVYGKPLIKNIPSDAQITKVRKEALNRAGKYAIQEIQREIRRASWNRSPKDLMNSFSYDVSGSTMTITSDHPATKYVDKGVKAHQMTYLEGASKPIPIITDDGDVIFRTASSRTMSDGSWQHPGFKGKNFIERGVEKGRERVKKELSKSYQQMIADALTGN